MQILMLTIYKPCGFVVKVTIIRVVLFSGIVVLVDWGVCVESVVDFVRSIEVICVGCVVDSWCGSKETTGVNVMKVVAILVVVFVECVECTVKNSINFIYKIRQLFLLTFVPSLCRIE